jgi:hypothetical protein
MMGPTTAPTIAAARAWFMAECAAWTTTEADMLALYGELDTVLAFDPPAAPARSWLYGVNFSDGGRLLDELERVLVVDTARRGVYAPDDVVAHPANIGERTTMPVGTAAWRLVVGLAP